MMSAAVIESSRLMADDPLPCTGPEPHHRFVPRPAEPRTLELLSVLNDVFDSLGVPGDSGVWHSVAPA